MNGRDDKPEKALEPLLATSPNVNNDPTSPLGDSAEDSADGSADGSPAGANEHPVAAPAGLRTSGRRRKALLVAAAAAIGLIAVGGGTAASLAKTVTITVDGQQREVTTLAGSVDGALSAAGLQAGEHDILAPSSDSAISDGSKIALEHARLLTLTIDGAQRQIWTTADTLDAALTQAGQDPNALKLSADRARGIPLGGLAVSADTLRTVSFSDAGAHPTARKTGARTVGDLLAQLHVRLGATDTVKPSASAALSDGLTIAVTRVKVDTVKETVAVPPARQKVNDPALNTGTSRVARKGTAGQQLVSTRVTTVNGTETERKVSRKTVSSATPTVIKVGTKSVLDRQGGRVFFHDTEYGVNWDGMAYCESTNNPLAVNNPDGFLSTYGLFQFDLPTWASVGGSGNPLDASPEEQLMRAKLLYKSRGLEPWLCGYAASGPPAG